MKGDKKSSLPQRHNNPFHQNKTISDEDEAAVETHEFIDEITLNDDFQSPPAKTLTKQHAVM